MKRLPALALACVLLAAAPAGEIIPGTKIDALPVGSTTYQQVEVRSINARTAVIIHRGGMSSIRLRDLPPEWRERFGYDPAAEAAAEARALPAPAPKPPRASARPSAPAGPSKWDALLLSFGQPAKLQSGVDLRPKFFELELGVKNQGSRPSCAVFAVVSALEFQNAELAGKVEKFSEEYLLWAVRKTVRRLPATNGPHANAVIAEDAYWDAGFSLGEVVAALRAYGIPLQASMPNTYEGKATADPTPAIVQEARNRQRVFVQQLPGRDRPTVINNVVQALNAGIPVPVGMNWPATRVVNGYISTHQGAPDRGHAVTLVGYKCPSGRIEDAYFIFKNSWGPRWGQGGYGTVTYNYLRDYLNDAILLEVQSG